LQFLARRRFPRHTKFITPQYFHNFRRRAPCRARRSRNGQIRVLQAYGKLPLSFMENQGQLAQEVRYAAHGSRYDLFLTPQEAVVALRHSQHLDFSPRHRAASLKALRALRKSGSATTTTASLRLRFAGANPAPEIAGLENLPGKVNYFIGNDPKKWHTGIPTFAQVKYSQVYPGVDLLFYGHQRNLEYDFIVAPGADPSAIRMSLSGARKLHLDAKGDVLVSVDGGDVVLQKPLVYQNINGRRQEIAANYSLRGTDVSFAIAPYDRREPLIVDPVLNYATYLGGTNDDGAGYAIAVDSSGDAYIAGQTLSTDFPAPSALTPGGNTAGTGFVVELNPAGTALLYSTYLGGSMNLGVASGGDFAFGIAVAGGDIYVTGETFETDFPTTASALKQTVSSNAAGTSFLTKLNPAVDTAASLLYSTYLGGSNGSFGDFGNAVAADSSGNAYVTGVTYSTAGTADVDFPVSLGAFLNALPSPAGSAFVTRIDTTQSGTNSLIYSTYLGGDGGLAAGVATLQFGDGGFGIVVGANNKVYVAGTTCSSPAGPYPTSATTFQKLPKAANLWSSAFISEIDTTVNTAAAAPTSLVYSTILGGSGDSNADRGDFGAAIDLQAGTTVLYVVGSTNSADFPVPNGFQTTGDATSGSAFVTLLDTSVGTALKYSTFLSDSGTSANGIKADAAGNAYVGGATASTTFSATPGAYQAALASGAPGDGFIAEIAPLGGGSSDLLYYTYFGGSGLGSTPDEIFGLALGTPPSVFATGMTASSNFPATTGAFQTSLKAGSTSEAFAAEVTLQPVLTITPLSLTFNSPIHVMSANQPIMISNNLGSALTFATPTVTITSGTGTAADFTVTNTSCGATIPSGGNCTINVSYTPSGTATETANLSLSGAGSAPQIVSLIGNTLAPFTVAPTSLSFTSSAVGTPTTAQTVTLTNNTAAPVAFTSAAVTLTSAMGMATDFAFPANPCGASIAPNGGICTISITYTPSVATTETATLTLTNGAATSPQTVSLTGNVAAVAPGFTLAITPTPIPPVTPGTPGSATVTVTSVGTFNAAVALSCAVVPKKASCNVMPASVTPAAGLTATSTLQFVTVATVAPPPASPRFPLGSIKVVVPVMLMLMIMFLLASEQRLRTRVAMVGVLLVFAILSGCSGVGSGGTPAGSYTVTVTGTSAGFTTQTATVSVTVQ
jgi:hypothetical protein